MWELKTIVWTTLEWISEKMFFDITNVILTSLPVLSTRVEVLIAVPTRVTVEHFTKAGIIIRLGQVCFRWARC